MQIDITGDGLPDLFTSAPPRVLGGGDTLDLGLLAGGYIRYVPAGNAFGVGADSFTYQVTDSGGAAFGVATLDPTPNTMTFDIGGINDVPTLTDLTTTLAVLEGDAPAIIDADVTLTDVEGNFDGGTLTVSGQLSEDNVGINNVGVGAGEIGLSGADVTYGGVTIGSYVGGTSGTDLVVTFNAAASVAAIEALIENLTYENASDTPTASRDLTVTVVDAASDATSQVVTVGVTAVNDTPEVTAPASGTISGSEGTAIAITGLQVADVDAGNAIVTVNIYSSVGSMHVSDSVLGGVTSVAGNDQNLVVVSFDGTMAQINATLAAPGAVTLNAGPDYSGPVVITFLMSDGGATGLDPGGPLPNAEYDVVQFTVDVLPVNDAPSGSDNTVTVAEDGTYTFAAADFGFSDPVEGNAFALVRVATLPGSGTLSLSGTPVSIGDLIDVADIDAGNLTFAPAADGAGAAYASFDFQVGDDGGTDNGGIDLDPSANTITIDVTASDDAPTVLIAAIGAAIEQVPLDLKTLIGVDDIDTTGDVTVTLTVVSGTLHVEAGTSGADVNEVSAGEVILTGTIAEIQALLGGDPTSVVTYTAHTDDPPADDELTVTIDDGTSPSSDTATIAITPVNDAPALDLDPVEPGNDAALAWTEGDGPLALAPLAVFADDNADFDGATLTVDITGNASSSDQLTILSVGDGTGEVRVDGADIYYEGVLVGSFTGGDDGNPLVATFNADACHCAIQTVMDSVAFEVTSATPSTDQRTVTFTLVDGGGTDNGGADTGTAQVLVDVAETDNAPTVAIAAVGTAIEQVPLDLKNLISVDDADTTGDVTVTLTVVSGTLHVEAGTSGVDVTVLFDEEVTLTGTIAEIQALLGSDPTSVVTYTADTDYPSPDDELTVEIDDGTSTNSDTATITITAVNDAPEVDLDFFGPGNDAALTWAEGDGPQLLAPYAYFDDDNDSHDGATLTITINSATAADQLTIDDVGTGLGELGVSGTDVTYEGVVVGSWSGGANGDPLIITFNADACFCSIELAMASILYENSDDLTAASIRAVDFTFVDGGGTANSGSDTTTSSVELRVVPAAEVVPGPDETGNEDAVIALTGVVIDGVADDPASDIITVRLDVAHGTLDLRTDVSGGLVAGDIVGNGSDFVVLTGTQDAINATLAASNGLTYQGDPDFAGNDELLIEAAGIVVGGTLEFTEIGGLPVPFPVVRLDMFDIDGDGTSDIVFGAPDTLIVYGSAVAIVPLDDPGIPTGFAFDDFDGDGEVDIAFTVAGPDGYVAFASSDTGDVVKLADLAGTFDIVTGDFNGDGLADLAATDGANGRVAVFLQDVPGTFQPVAYTTPTTALAGTLAVGDFNGDTYLDLLVANAAELPGPVPPGSIDLLLGNGDGTFQAPVEVLSTPATPGEVVVADFDGDGALDFAYASSNGGGPGANGVVVALGNGDGTFGTPVDYDTTADGEPAQLVAADFDGDGVLDLAVANMNDPGTFSILVGNGDGSFQAAVDFDTYYPAFAIAFGDPDGDGDMDLITGSIAGGIEFFNNDLDETVRTASATKDIAIGAVNDAPTSTDLAGDNVTWSEGDAAVLLDAGTGATFGDIDSTDFDGGSLTLAITGGDPAQDVLAIVNQGTDPGEIGVSGADVTYGGVTIGTVAGGTGGTALTVSFNAGATAEAIEALAGAITYGNTGGSDPVPGTRTVGWTLVDGDGTANGGADTLALTTSVTVVDGSPVIDLNGVDPGTSNAISYSEGLPLVAIAPAATVTDPNSADLDGGVLTVEITANADPDDYLALVGGSFTIDEVDLSYGGVVIGSIAGGGGGSPLVVVFNAAATPAIVEALVQTIGFANYWTSPGNLQREVTFTLSDGDGDTSAPVVATVDVTDIFAAPVAANDEFDFIENDVTGGSLFADNGFGNDFDPQGGAIQVTEVNGVAANVGATITLASGSSLTVSANGTFSYDPHGAFGSMVPAESGAVNFEVSDTFTYTITGGATATALVTQHGIVSAGDIYMGDGGNNAIVSTAADDYFDVSQGGDDSVYGFGGDDAFYFGAEFTGGDSVDGGAGDNDQIGLEGDYTGANALLLGPTTITGIEVIALLPGYDYDITTDNANVPNGGLLKVFASTLGVGDDFTFDGSAETDGGFMVFGGLGTDDITTGAGEDGIYFGPDKFDPLVDRVDGGSGPNDQLALDGHYGTLLTPLTLDGTAIQNIDVIALLEGEPGDLADYNLVLADSLVAAGQTMTLWGCLVETAITIDGSLETDATSVLRMFGGKVGDTLTGGAGDDWFWGGLGGDTLEGGAGIDTFFYETAAQSAVGGFDRIVGFDDTVDKIDLDGLAVASFATAASGTLNAASIGATLEAAFSALTANQAGVFTATGGDMDTRSFLVIDANGTTGYQANGDFLIELVSPTSPIDQVGMFV